MGEAVARPTVPCWLPRKPRLPSGLLANEYVDRFELGHGLFRERCDGIVAADVHEISEASSAELLDRVLSSSRSSARRLKGGEDQS
jgi:hypothetical protein